MYLVSFPNGEYSSFSPTSGDKLGKGATADIYRFQHAGKSYAAKILKNVKKQDREKIDAMISMASSGTTDGNSIPFRHLTWPIARIEKDGDLIGFAMPILNHQDFIGLESFFDYNLRRNLPSADFLSISLLVDLARRLAEVLTLLHSNGIHVVDLKPQNILVSKNDLSVHILDCDGFSLKKGRKRYPAEHVSADYICPETTNRNMSPSDLGEGQDRYAFAVLVFQLFNKGVHPFQGIIADPSIDAPTNDQKAEQGLYAYGLMPNTNISPNPRSVHSNFPTSLRSLFDRAFMQTDLMRPGLTEWKDYFSDLAAIKQFKRCQKYPVDAAHIHFSEGSCIECYLLALSDKTIWKPGISTPLTQPYPSQQKPTVRTKNSGNAVFGFFALFLIIVVAINLAGNKRRDRLADIATSVPSTQYVEKSLMFDIIDGNFVGDNFEVTIANPMPREIRFKEILIDYVISGCGDNIATTREVTLIQISLAAKGYRIDTDGVYGPKTKSVLMKFQKDRGLPATGIVTVETAKLLNVKISGLEQIALSAVGSSSVSSIAANAKHKVTFFNLASKLSINDCINYEIRGIYQE